MNGGEVSRGSGQAHSIGSSCLDSDLIRGKHREEMRRWRRRGRVASTCDTPLAAVPIRKSPTCLLIKSWQMKTPHLLLKAAPASCHKIFFSFQNQAVQINHHQKLSRQSGKRFNLASSNPKHSGQNHHQRYDLHGVFLQVKSGFKFLFLQSPASWNFKPHQHHNFSYSSSVNRTLT